MTDIFPRSAKEILNAVKEVEKDAAGAAEALYMAAMLAETPLPYDFALSVEGTPHNPSLINPAAAFFAATVTINPLITRHLIKIDADEQIFQLHEDVRHVLHEAMTSQERIQWASRAIYALNLVLPDAEPANWPTVEWLMPHVMACRTLVTDLGITSAAANRVLHQAGFSLHYQNRHSEAADLLDHALAVDVALKGRQHPDICADLEGLGNVLWAGQDHERAETAFAGCLELQKEIFTDKNPITAPILNSLAVVRQALGKWNEAETTFKECLRVLTQTHGDGHPSIAACLSNLALLYEAMNKPEEALRLAERSLEINRDIYGNNHPEVAADLNMVGLLQDELGHENAAENHFRESLEVRRSTYGEDHPETAQSLCNLALFLDKTGHEAEAASLYEQGLAAYESSLGPDHSLLEPALDNYITLLEKTGSRPTSDALRMLTEAKLRAIVERVK
ncbi:tetratricopeptide repeat protein [Pseudodesulfovibrio piezophilus]|uniref:Tetratricopeptide domain protein n=1 Tax=Pseudodesulfovibrio piezophilus (strain DSM 21447 / JCM 15486 / C1TLV30) TaxID=1322246 RepID=M1WKI2_PSEP2|nr:tetratricopeptide repeat protein [Pseudodesulfovibrio piezophilus]CCH49646.1 Tetratricopeptide domain protein [Pseudodesulfovibrio piezophilus C1TLV30]